MTVYRDLNDASGLYAVLIAILALGLFVDAVFGFAERTMRTRRGLAEAE